jgi:hypothetical protein
VSAKAHRSQYKKYPAYRAQGVGENSNLHNYNSRCQYLTILNREPHAANKDLIISPSSAEGMLSTTVTAPSWERDVDLLF